MIKINYPLIKPKIRRSENSEEIFCIIRKKWLVITPEEWVRQNFLLFLIHELKYSASLIAVEKKICIGEINRRFDIVVYSKNTEPLIVVECKEMEVALNEATILQVLRYNAALQAKFLVVTNGVSCAAFENRTFGFVEIQNMPPNNI